MESFKQYTRDTADKLSKTAGKLIAAPFKIERVRRPLKETIKGGILLTRWLGKSLEYPQEELGKIFREAQKETRAASQATESRSIPIKEEDPLDKLEEKSREKLYQMAQKYDVSGRSEMNKQELIQAIKKARDQ